MLISKFNLASNDLISEYEDNIDAKLPDTYKIFLQKYNGGETPNTKFSTQDTTSDIKGFYGIGNVKYSLDTIKLIVLKGKNYLPIAFDSFGNDVIIGLGDEAIYFLDHETNDIKRIADGLKAFIDICISQPISTSSVKSVEEREKALIAKGRGNIINDALRDMWRAEIKKYSSICLEEVKI